MKVINKVSGTATIKSMNLKNQLKNYLDHFDMTAAQLSRKSGVSQQVLSTWLRGGDPKKMTQVKKVADSLNTSVDNLCFGSGISRGQNEEGGFQSLMNDEWVSGVFEVKIRRVKK